MSNTIDSLFIKAIFCIVCLQYTKNLYTTILAGSLVLAIGVAIYLMTDKNRE